MFSGAGAIGLGGCRRGVGYVGKKLHGKRVCCCCGVLYAMCGVRWMFFFVARGCFVGPLLSYAVLLERSSIAFLF